MERFTPYIWAAIGIAVISVVVVRILAWSKYWVWSGWLRISFLAEFLSAVKDLERERARLASFHRCDIRVLAVGWSYGMADRRLHQPFDHARCGNGCHHGHNLLRDRRACRARSHRHL